MKSLTKAFDILEVFLAHKGELSLSEIARITKLNISTIHGIISFLCTREYIVQRGKRGKYTLGYRFLEFGDAIIRDLPICDLAFPYMKELSGLANENVVLDILSGNNAMEISRVEPTESTHELTVAGRLERKVPLYCTGIGKVLLAYQSEEEWEKYLSETTLQPFTSFTITDHNKLKEQLRDIRRQGYAIDNQETELGIINIAVPVKDRKNEIVAAVGILGPTVRIPDSKIGELVMAVKGCALEISRDLGSRIS